MSLRMPVVIAVAGMMSLAGIGCKKSSSSSSGGPAPTSYVGTWTLGNTITSSTGSCSVAGGGSVTVAANGSFTFSTGATTISGTLNTTSGSVSATITDAQCGNGSLSGSCSSFRTCAGTYTQTGGSNGSQSGNWTFSR